MLLSQHGCCDGTTPLRAAMPEQMTARRVQDDDPALLALADLWATAPRRDGLRPAHRMPGLAERLVPSTWSRVRRGVTLSVFIAATAGGVALGIRGPDESPLGHLIVAGQVTGVMAALPAPIAEPPTAAPPLAAPLPNAIQPADAAPLTTAVLPADAPPLPPTVQPADAAPLTPTVQRAYAVQPATFSRFTAAVQPAAATPPSAAAPPPAAIAPPAAAQFAAAGSARTDAQVPPGGREQPDVPQQTDDDGRWERDGSGSGGDR